MTSLAQVSARAPAALTRIWRDESAAPESLIYRPDNGRVRGLSLARALVALDESSIQPPEGLIPITFVDDWSLACLVTIDDPSYGWIAGEVVRWHLDDIDARHQGAIVDVDIELYVESLVDELGPAWQRGLTGVKRVADNYRRQFLDKGETPKVYELRPFQLACQNVIIGFAAFRQDASIDGHAVPYWLTCEAPHVALYEGARALSALLLCDAFQAGGTMEISFSGHAERRVPASLRRFARTRGVTLGEEIKQGSSISPREARALFMAVTSMPAELRARSTSLISRGVLSAERLCYTLVANVWSAVALDFLAATASEERLRSMLSGGADVFDRPNRSPEMELTRAAVLVDTFLRRVDMRDTAAGESGSVRTFEDTRIGVSWRIHGDLGAVAIEGLAAGPLPWAQDAWSDGRLLLLPRAHPIIDDFKLAEQLRSSGYANGAPVALLTSGSYAGRRDHDIPVLRCPIRVEEIDLDIERKLASLAMGRI